MATASTPAPTSAPAIRGKIVEAEVKASVDPTRPLPFVSALYAIDGAEGVWLCAYYGANRSNFDYLPQKGAEFDESHAGIVFHLRKFIPKNQYQPGVWEEFRKARLITHGGHEE